MVVGCSTIEGSFSGSVVASGNIGSGNGVEKVVGCSYFNNKVC